MFNPMMNLLALDVSDNAAVEAATQHSENTLAFLTMDNLKVLLNQFITWAIGMALNILFAFIAYKVGKFLMKWLIKIAERTMTRGNFDAGVIKFMCSLIKCVVYAVIALVVLDILGFKTASLVAIFGSVALAVSMSLQGSLANLAGGILILLFRPFHMGDYIVSGGCEGTVVSIDILYTKLKTADNRIVMMPNGALSNSNIINVGAEGTRRLEIPVSISYGSDVTKAKAVLVEIMEQYPTILHEQPVCAVVKSLDDSSVLIETRCYVTHENYWDVRFVLIEKYKLELEKNGIEIPFPQLDVHMK